MVGSSTTAASMVENGSLLMAPEFPLNADALSTSAPRVSYML